MDSQALKNEVNEELNPETQSAPETPAEPAQESDLPDWLKSSSTETIESSSETINDSKEEISIEEPAGISLDLDSASEAELKLVKKEKKSDSEKPVKPFPKKPASKVTKEPQNS